MDVRNRVKETPLQEGFHFWEQKVSAGAKSGEYWGWSSTVTFRAKKNQSPDSAMPGLTCQILFSLCPCQCSPRLLAFLAKREGFEATVEKSS
jgi:hypothetical protein